MDPEWSIRELLLLLLLLLMRACCGPAADADALIVVDAINLYLSVINICSLDDSELL